jgi:phosphoribosylamine-glycine ligase
MKILILGSGGREHALAWKLRQSPRVTELYCAPGNGGTSEIATCVPLKLADQEALEALTALGYTVSEARQALSHIPKDIEDVGDRLKRALKSLGKK